MDRSLLGRDWSSGQRALPHGWPSGKSCGRERDAMKNWPRVAFFSDSYHGVDGVATTCRNIVAAARRRDLPFLAVHAAERNSHSQDGSLEILELDRGPISFPLDLHLRFDLLFTRHYQPCAAEPSANFARMWCTSPGPGDVGITGARVAYELGIPLVASWHTNLHEFAARRLWKFASLLPEAQRQGLTYLTQKYVLQACLRFYKIARVILAPNAGAHGPDRREHGQAGFSHAARSRRPPVFSGEARRLGSDFPAGIRGKVAPGKERPFPRGN